MNKKVLLGIISASVLATSVFGVAVCNTNLTKISATDGVYTLVLSNETTEIDPSNSNRSFVTTSDGNQITLFHLTGFHKTETYFIMMNASSGSDYMEIRYSFQHVSSIKFNCAEKTVVGNAYLNNDYTADYSSTNKVALVANQTVSLEGLEQSTPEQEKYLYIECTSAAVKSIEINYTCSYSF